MPKLNYKVVYNRIDNDTNEIRVQDTRWFLDREEFEDWLALYNKINGKYEHLEIVSEGWDRE